jgi:hypothetical protein
MNAKPQKKDTTIDAQRLKALLLETAKKIGKRKRIAAAKIFSVMMESL